IQLRASGSARWYGDVRGGPPGGSSPTNILETEALPSRSANCHAGNRIPFTGTARSANGTWRWCAGLLSALPERDAPQRTRIRILVLFEMRPWYGLFRAVFGPLAVPVTLSAAQVSSASRSRPRGNLALEQ